MAKTSSDFLILRILNIEMQPERPVDAVEQKIDQKNRVEAQRYNWILALNRTEVSLHNLKNGAQEDVLRLDTVTVSFQEQQNRDCKTMSYTRISVKIPLIHIELTLMEMKLIAKLMKSVFAPQSNPKKSFEDSTLS